MNGPILRWIEAFLVDRVQGVVVEGFRSVRSATVPHGTRTSLVFTSYQ